MKFSVSSVLATLVIAAAPVLGVIAPAGAMHAGLAGTWQGPADTRGIVKLQITREGGNFTSHAWGACSPTACDMGSAPLSTFGATVDSSRPNGGTATFTESFATRTMTVTLLAGGDLQMDLFTKFTDHSGRKNYDERERFTKV